MAIFALARLSRKIFNQVGFAAGAVQHGLSTGCVALRDIARNSFSTLKSMLTSFSGALEASPVSIRVNQPANDD